MNNELIIKNQEELDNIIKGGGCNSRIFIEFGTFDHKAMLNNIKSPVYVCGDYYIEAHGDASIEAYGRAHVSAYDNVSVEAYDKTIVEAHGNACVEAYDNAVIKAYDDSSVESFNRASVYAYNNSHAKTYDYSSVYAYDNSFIIGYRKSLIDAYDNASVEAYDNAYIAVRYKSAIVGYNKVSIYASEDASIIAFNNVSVETHRNASVEAYDDAHIEIYDRSTAKVHDRVHARVADNASIEAYGNTYIETIDENASVKAFSNSRVYDLAGCTRIELNDYASVATSPKDLEGYTSFNGIKATESSFIAYSYAVKGDDGRYYLPSNPHDVFAIGDKIITEIKNLSGALCDYQRDCRDCAIIELRVDKSSASIGDKYMIGDEYMMRFPVVTIREIPLEECGALGKIILEKKKRTFFIGDEGDEEDY